MQMQPYTMVLGVPLFYPKKTVPRLMDLPKIEPAPAPKKTPHEKRLWTPEETKKLVEMYGSATFPVLVQTFGRTRSSIKQKAHEMGLVKVRHYVHWTEEEKEKLRELYPHHMTIEIAAIFGRSPGNINKVACEMGLKKTSFCVSKTNRYKTEKARARRETK